MKKRVLSMVMIMMFVVSLLLPAQVEATNTKWDVKISDVDYYLEFNDSSDTFLCNQDSVGTEVGTEYYMTYTVESMNTSDMKVLHQGVIGTNYPSAQYPYVSGGNGYGGYMQSKNQNHMLIVGNTYFLKFTITKDGYTCRASWANDKYSDYFEFDWDIGEVKTGLGYFGTFFSGTQMTGKLTKIRCYDKNGKDLGIQFVGKNVSGGREKPFPKDTEVNHTYDITVSDAFNVGISNKFKPTSDKVYMEYRVKESKGTHVYQAGVINSTTPTISYIYQGGFMYCIKYPLDPKKCDAGALLVPGAEYLIIFEKKADKYNVTVQQTLKGKVTYINVKGATAGKYNPEAEFFTLWSGEGKDFVSNFTLEDFKCYDSNKKNLGVQCNQKATIVHHGELESYAGCEAIYYCREDGSLYALYEDKKLKYTEDGKTEEGTYIIEKDILTTNVASSEKKFDYLYKYFTSEDGKVYERLHTYKVTFVTGTDSKIDEQIVNAENGYLATKPNNPTDKGNSFEGWYTVEGEEYDFESIVADSITLYAKWEDMEYKEVGAELTKDNMLYLGIGIGAFGLVMAIIGGTIIIIRGKKHAGKGKA